MNSKTEHDIRQCLAIILGKESGDLETAIRMLDTLKESAKGHLAHYLTKRSYQKAWMLLEGGDPEKGTC
jgi:hypothetical protein